MKQRNHGLLTFTLTITLISRLAVANPVGGVVTGGDANALIVGQGTAQTTINQNADRVVIRWDQFSIAAGEVTTFVQPSATAAALNLVNSSANPSAIFGTLQANGNVLLLNPNGIIVGAGGVIDTGGFLASTLDVNESEFLSGGDLRFSGSSSAGILNQGSINARSGNIFLIAPKVDNQGTLGALGGTVGIAAGSDVRLVQAGAERIAVLAGNAAAGAGETGINNSGSITAASAELKAAGGNIYALAINNSGIIRATTMANEGGLVVIKADGGDIENSGTLDASGTTGGSVTVSGGHNAGTPATVISSGNILATGSTGSGGSVQVLGDQVGLFGNARVDVSGRTGGGTALIGGDFQGANAAVQNAQQTIVAPDAIIRADATANGNGGRVIVWADGSTRYYGSISAQGGALGGNGGFAEVSGKELLDFSGRVNLTAANGTTGTLLLDPKFIFVVSNGVSTLLTNMTFAETPSLTNVITSGSLSNLLTSANVILQANTDIVFSNGVAVAPATGNNDLTLQAGRSIILTNGVSILLNGSGSFSATVNDAGADAANRDAGQAQFFMATNASIRASGGITIRSGDLAFASDGAVGSNNVGVAANVGNFTLNNLTSGYAAADTVSSGDGGHGGSISITNSVGNITVLGSLIASGQTTTATTGGLNVGGNAGAVTLVAAGSVLAGNAQIFASGGNGEDGGHASNVTVNAGTGIAIGSIAAVAGTGGVGTGGTVTLHATNGGVTQGTSGVIAATDLAMTGSGTFALTGSNRVGTIAANVSGPLTYVSSNLVVGTVNGVVGITTASNYVTLVADRLTVGNVINAGTSNVSISTLAAGRAINFGGADSATDLGLSITDLGNIQAGMLHVGAANAGAITVNNDPNVNYNVELQTASTIAFNSGLTATNRSVTLDHVGAVTGSGIITASNLNLQGTGDVGTLANNLNTTVGAIAFAKPAGSVFVNNTTAVNLEGTTAGTLNVTAAGDIVTVNALTGGSNATFTTGPEFSVLLTNANNNFGTVAVNTGNGVIRDSNSVNLATSTATNLSINASGDITQTGGLLTVVSNLTATVDGIGRSVRLGSNNLVGGTFAVGSTTGSTVLDVEMGNRAAGSFAQTLFPASVRNLTLNFTNSAVTLGGVIVSNNLIVNAGGAIDQSAAITVGNQATLNATTNFGVVLNDGANNFNNLSVTGLTAQVTDLNGLVLGASRILTDYTVNAGGNVTQSAPVNVGSNLTVSVTGPNRDVLLGSNNLVGGIFTVAATAGSTVRDVAIGNFITNSSGATVFPNAVRNLTLTYSNSAVQLGGVNVSSNLTVTAGGNITQNAAVTVGNNTLLTVRGGSDITLDNLNNEFSGPVTATNSSGSGINNLTLHNNVVNAGTTSFAVGSVTNLSLTFPNSGISFGTTRVANNLTATAGGNISQTGELFVGRNTALTVTPNGASIQLAGFQNNLGTNLTVTGPVGGALSTLAIRNTNSGATAPTGSYALTNLTLVHDNAAIALGTITNVIGNLSLTAGGPITQSTGLTVGGTTSLTASNRSVTLGDANNDFGGVVSVVAGNATLVDANNIQLGAVAVGTNFNLTALSGGISGNGVVTVGNVATLLATNGNVTLANAANNFNVANVVAQDATLVDANGLQLGTAAVTGNLNVMALTGDITGAGVVTVDNVATLLATNGNVTLANAANDFDTVVVHAVNGTLADSNTVFVTAPILTGDLTVSAATDAYVYDALVEGDVTIRAGNAAYFYTSFLQQTNRVGQNLSVSATNGEAYVRDSFVGGNVGITSLNNQARLVAILASSNRIGGNLTVNSGSSSLAQVQNTYVGQSTTITGGSQAQLSSSQVTGNAVVSAASVDVTSSTVGQNLTATATTTTASLNTVTVGNDATVTAPGEITLNNVSVTQDLAATSLNGGISGLGTVTAGGQSTLLATNGDVTLANVANNFNQVTVVAQNATLSDANGLQLTGATIATNLAVTAVAGSITGGGVVTVGGLATLEAKNGDVTLANAANDFNIASVSAVNGTLVDANGLQLGTTTLGNNLNVTALDGSITGSDVVTVGGQATLLAAKGDVTLANAANNFNTVSVTATNATLVDANGLQFTAATVASNLNVTALNGDITGGGVVTVGNRATLLAANGNVSLADAANDFNTVAVTATNVTLVDANGLRLLAVAAAGNLNVTTLNGSIIGSDVVTVGNTATLQATSGDVTLANAANDFNSVTVSANNGSLRDVDNIVLNNMTLANNLTVVAGGDINGTGTQNVGGIADYTSTGLGLNGNIQLNNTANQFGSLRLISANGSTIRVVESDATVLGDVLTAASGTASIRSGGSVSQLNGTTVRVANLAVTANSGSVTLTNANQFTALAVAAQSAVNIAVTNAPGTFLTIGSVDGVNGITTGAADVSIRADRVMVSSPINTAGSNNAVSFTAWSATTNSDTLQIGGTATNLSSTFFVSGLNNVNAHVVRIGSTNSFGADINIANSILLGTVTNDSRTLSLLTAGGDITQNSTAYVRVNSLAMFARSILMTPLEPNCNDFLRLAYGGTTLGAADVTIFYEFPGAIDVTSTIEGLKIEPDNLDKIIDDCGKGINRVPTGVYYIAPFAAQQLFLQAYGVEPIPLGEGGDESLFSRGGWGPRSIWTSYLNLPFLGYKEKEFRLEDVPNWIIKDESKWPKDPKGEKFDEQSKPQAQNSEDVKNSDESRASGG